MSSTVPFNSHRFSGFGGTRKLACFTKAKAKSPERERLAALLARQEKAIQRAFALFVSASTDAAAMREVSKLLAANRIDDALALVDRHIGRLANTLAESFISVGNAEANSWSDKLGTEIAFDQTATTAVQMMQANRLEFVTNFTAKQRAATHAALVAGAQQGLGAVPVARMFKDSIGLTQSQLTAVANYRRLLTTGSSDALSRDLRDRRFDGTVTRSIATHEPLTTRQLDAMVDRYRLNALTYRAEVIARTESLRVMGSAQFATMGQTLEQTGISRGLVIKDWMTNIDGRQRDTHEHANGQRRLLDQAFDVGDSRMMYPGDASLGAPIKERADCRCAVSYTIARDAEHVAELLAA